MDPQRHCCHNPSCPARGKVGEGTIRVHSRTEQHYRCTCCGHTFAATKDTPFYRLPKASELMVVVLTLLSHGCPLQAIVAAFRLDERTVARWQARAGQHCQQVHEHLVQQGQVELGHVQADERWVKVVGGKIWMALALVAPEGATHRWIERTPAMAAGLTAHCWTMADLLHYQVPLSPWVAPKHRGRPPKRQETPVLAGAA